MDKWEYKILNLDFERRDQELERLANELGALGWELVSVNTLYSNFDEAIWCAHAFFKRRKQ